MVLREQLALEYCTCESTIPKTFNSPQRVKAKCFTTCASALGSDEGCNASMSTNSAAEDSSPPLQIISASASILSLLESSSVLSGGSSPAPACRTSLASHGSFVSNACRL